MTWAKLDDQFPDAEKVEILSDAAFRVHVRAICHAARTTSDGWILRKVVDRWDSEAAIECLDIGVWHAGDAMCAHCVELLRSKAELTVVLPRPNMIYVHDWLDYNRSRVEVERERNAARTRKERWEEQRRNGVPNGVTNSAPTRPDLPTEDTRARTRRKAENLDPSPPKFEGRCEECALFLPDHAESCSRALPEASTTGAGDGLAMLEAF